jgi:hypothetical protein
VLECREIYDFGLVQEWAYFGRISSGFCYYAAQKVYIFTKFFKLRPKDQFDPSWFVSRLKKFGEHCHRFKRSREKKLPPRSPKNLVKYRTSSSLSTKLNIGPNFLNFLGF